MVIKINFKSSVLKIIILHSYKMDSNVRKVIFVVLILLIFIGTVFVEKYFHISRENCLTFAIVILTLLLLVQTFVHDKKECYNNTDEKPRVYKYASLSRYNSV